MATALLSPSSKPRKQVYILPCNPSADAQEHAILCDEKAVDSVGHHSFGQQANPCSTCGCPILLGAIEALSVVSEKSREKR
jgi:hypothetical protein